MVQVQDNSYVEIKTVKNAQFLLIIIILQDLIQNLHIILLLSNKVF